MNALLELRHFRYFLAVAEELHFTRAAERVFLTQPALSQQIKSLEEIVGTQLFDRSQRKIRLTEAGKIFLHGARRAIYEVERSVHEVRQSASLLRLSLGYVEYGFQSVANPIIRNLLQRYPQLRIERREVEQTDISQALNDCVIDIGIAMLPLEGMNISSRAIRQARWQLVMPEAHSFAQRQTIPLNSLTGIPLLMFSRTVNQPLYDFVLNHFRRAGVEPNVVYETSQVDAGQNMVVLGVGLWVVASHVINGRLLQGLVARDLSDFSEIQIGYAWRSEDTSDVLNTAIEVIEEQFSN